MHLDKVIFLALLCPFIEAQFSEQVKEKLAEFLKKPHVLPSAERAYHAVYHELDTTKVGTLYTPNMGQVYVALIEDQFTFGGDFEEWDKKLFKDGKRSCKPFMATNVHHFCDDNYFLVHQDMIKLQKTAFGGGAENPDFKTVCKGFGFRPTDDPDNNFVYRYKHRVLMSYKRDDLDHKCIGTYDALTDTFTCMKKDKNKSELIPLEIQHFLWNQDTGNFARGKGNVEVFCKELHGVK